MSGRRDDRDEKGWGPVRPQRYPRPEPRFEPETATAATLREAPAPTPSEMLAEAVAPPPPAPAAEPRDWQPTASPAPPPRKAKARKLTWREQRWLRRRRRNRAEEILGWIFVPLILIFAYWFATFVIGALGTSPEAIIQALRSLGGGGAP